MRAALWLGPQDGLELDVEVDTIREGAIHVPDAQENAHLLAGGVVFDGHSHGTYRLRTAADGIACLDAAGRLTFEWEGWS